MTRDEIKSRIPVLQAWLEQKAIQFRWHGVDRISSWTDFTIAHGDHPDIFNPDLEWRLKPSEPPKPREWWIELAGDLVLSVSRRFISIKTRDTTAVVHVREVL